MAKTTAQASKKDTSKTEANRKARITKHLKKHPKDLQTKSNIDNFNARSKSKNKTGQVDAKHKLVQFVSSDVGFKSVVPTYCTYTQAEITPRYRATQKEHATRMSKLRKDTANTLREAKAQFGSVKPNIFGTNHSVENVRALCFGLGVRQKSSKRSKR